MKRKKLWIVIGVVAIVGIIAIVLSRGKTPSSSTPGSKTAQKTHEHKEKKQLWTCGMHPQVIQEQPGLCPICNMNLVPLKTDDDMDTSDVSGDSAGWDDISTKDTDHREHEKNVGPKVKLSKGLRQTVGVVSAPVEEKQLSLSINTVGFVDFNENAITWVTTKFGGWIEKVYVNYVGQKVKKGQKLFDVYSPDLVSTQEELLSALRYAERLASASRGTARKQAQDLVEAARERLRYWDIPDHQIKQIEESGKVRRTIPVVSLSGGVVVEKMDKALEGMQITPGMNLYKIAGLSSVWIHAELYEHQVPWIHEGQIAKVDFPYFAGETFEAKVLFTYPEMSEKTRTLRVCLELPNPQQKIRSKMYANVSLVPDNLPVALQVPKEAVIRGNQQDLVIVDQGNGSFQPRVVKLGVEGNNTFVVAEGLSKGELVVTSSQFLLNSESNLKEAIQKLLGDRAGTSPKPAIPTGHQH